MFNAYWEPLEFELPPLPPGDGWLRAIDTALPGPEDATMLQFQRLIGEAMGRRPFTLSVPAAVLRLAGIGADVGRRWRRTRNPFGSDKVSEALQPGWVVSGEKARRCLGFAPRIGLREGVAEALAWYRAQGWL